MTDDGSTSATQVVIPADEARRCSVEGCRAVTLDATRVCLLHSATDHGTQAIEKARADGQLDLQGALLSPEALERVRDLWPSGDDPEPWTVLLDGCTAPEALSFAGLGFGPESSIADVTFEGRADFGGCSFGAETKLQRVTFRGSVGLAGARFHGRCWLTDATFEHGLWAKGARFGSVTNFQSVDFGAGAYLRLATFEGSASFRHCSFGSTLYIGDSVVFRQAVSFYECTFGAGAVITEAVAVENASFTRCTFADVTLDMLSWSTVTIESCRFSGRADIRIIAVDAVVTRSDFEQPTQLRLGRARLTLTDSTFAQPVLVARQPPSRVSATPPVAGRWLARGADVDAETATINRRPTVASVRGTDLGTITLGDADLGECLFAPSHNLDQLRIEDTSTFHYAAGRFSARRRVIREEREYCEIRKTPPQERRALARSVARTYRMLRRGREDRGDEPGAADFYYGEMHMRLRGAESGFEKVLLAAYWAVSGYGLRAWRAVAALLVVIAAATACFATFGFDHTSTPVFTPDPAHPTTVVADSRPGPKPGVVDAITYSVTSATALLRPTPAVPLRPAGQLVEVTLRVLGPILIGLAALAIRARLKR